MSQLKLNVKIKDKKPYTRCFSGSDAVDVVWHQLQTMRDSIPKEITREKAVKVFNFKFKCNNLI